MSPRGLHQTRKVGMLKTFEISISGSQDFNKTMSSHFFTLRNLSRDPTKWAPTFCWSSHGAQNAPRELPGTPKDHPEPPDDPIGPPRNANNLPRTYQVPARALLTSPKGIPDAKKRPEEHQVCGCPAPWGTTTTHIRFKKYVVVLPPPR